MCNRVKRYALGLKYDQVKRCAIKLKDVIGLKDVQ